jgi:hypothetical protein
MTKIKLIGLLMVMIIVVIGGVYGFICVLHESQRYTQEEIQEIVPGQILEKHITSDFLGLSERYAIPVHVDGKSVLFHTSIATGLKVRVKQTILLKKTTYITKRDGIVIKEASYYNWHKWD